MLIELFFQTIEFTELLIKHGADVYANAIFDDDDWTPLDMASLREGKFMSRLLRKRTFYHFFPLNLVSIF